MNFRDLPGSGILHDVVTLNDIAIPQPNFISGIQTVVTFRGHLAEVLPLDPELAAKGQWPRALARVLGVVDRFQELNLTFGIVRQYQLEGAQHGHYTESRFVQILANVIFELLELGDAVRFGDAEIAGKIAQPLRRKTAPAHAAKSRHPRIIPALHDASLYQMQELAFTQ